MLRRAALAEAIRSVAAFLAGDGARASAGRARRAGERPRVPRPRGVARRARTTLPARLLDLPHGNRDAEALFVARAAAVTDGGRLELTERGGRVVATFSWPASRAGAAGKAAA